MVSIGVAILLAATAVTQAKPSLNDALSVSTNDIELRIAQCIPAMARTLAGTSQESASVLADLAVYRCSKQANQKAALRLREEVRLAALDAIVEARK